MRTTERIDPVLRELAKIWKKNPDLRLGQLLWAIAGRDPFHIEDYDMVKAGAEMFCVESAMDDFPPYWVEMGRDRRADVREKASLVSNEEVCTECMDKCGSCGKDILDCKC